MTTALTVVGRWLRRLGFAGLLAGVPIMGLLKILAVAPWGDLRTAFLLAVGCTALGGLLSLTSVVIRVERHRREVRAAIAAAIADEPDDHAAQAEATEEAWPALSPEPPPPAPLPVVPQPARLPG